MNIAFDYPFFLFLLPLLICFILCKKALVSQYLPKIAWIPKRDRFINTNTLLKMIIFTFLVLALAKPFSYDAITPSQKYGRNIVLALDTSGSMSETGIKEKEPDKSKFELMLESVTAFIDKRVSDNIGVVAFGTFAFTATPITYDHQSLKTLLALLEVEIAGKNTAIGDGIAQSLTTLSFVDSGEKIIILLTDGMNNSGKVAVKQAVENAIDRQVKVYTIGFGEKKDFDVNMLSQISSQTGGKMYAAVDADDLDEVYSEIDSLIPTKIRSEQYLNQKPLFLIPLFLAVILMMWWMVRSRI